MIAIILLSISAIILAYSIGNYLGYIEALDDVEKALTDRFKEGDK